MGFWGSSVLGFWGSRVLGSEGSRVPPFRILGFWGSRVSGDLRWGGGGPWLEAGWSG